MLHEPLIKNGRVGTLYALLLAALVLLCFATWPFGIVLIWPIVSVAIVIAGYFGLGARIFRKRAGRLSLTTRVLLGPVLAGQYLSLLHYRRQCNAWDVVALGVWIGRRLNDAEARQAVADGVTAVIDLSGEFSEARPFVPTNCRYIPVLDLTAPTQQQLREAVDFIEEQSSTGVVYVHCKIGYSRSAGIVAAWLLASGRAASVDDAIEQLRAVRPTIVVRPEIRRALDEFARSLTRTEGT